jgi:hypothetical protein
MSRIAHFFTTLLVIVTFTVAVSIVRPQPVMAETDTTTILIVLGAVVGGLALIALIMTLIVRNNPAWMPLGPTPDLSKSDRFGRPPDKGVQFGLGCGVRDGALPLICW